jgi:hypothetical protein
MDVYLTKRWNSIFLVEHPTKINKKLRPFFFFVENIVKTSSQLPHSTRKRFFSMMILVVFAH